MLFLAIRIQLGRQDPSPNAGDIIRLWGMASEKNLPSCISADWPVWPDLSLWARPNGRAFTDVSGFEGNTATSKPPFRGQFEPYDNLGESAIMSAITFFFYAPVHLLTHLKHGSASSLGLPFGIKLSRKFVGVA